MWWTVLISISFNLVFFTNASFAFANSSDEDKTSIFVWQNSSGFKEAKNCEFYRWELEKTPFFLTNQWVTEGQENLLPNFEGDPQVFLPKETLLWKFPVTEGGPEQERQQKGQKQKVKVIGFSQSVHGSGAVQPGARLDQGYIRSELLTSISDSVFELTSDEKNAKIGNHVQSVKGVFLRPHIVEGEDVSFVKAVCKEGATNENYFLFAASHPKVSEQPFAYVGIGSETEILSSFAVHSIEDADDVFQKRKSEKAQLQSEDDHRYGLGDSFVNYPVVSPFRNHDRNALASIDTVTCTEQGLLNVRKLNRRQQINARRISFQVKNFERVKIFNGKKNRKQATINGGQYTFVKVQFTEAESRSRREGWVARKYLVDREQCPYKPRKRRGKDRKKSEPNQKSPSQKNGDKNQSRDDDRNKKVSDAQGFVFPTVKRPRESYLTAQKRFGAGRSGGRKHAACDLYRYRNDIAVSVQNGRVIRGPYKFYQGTFAIEVKHSNGYVARYGEITGKRAPGIGYRSRVKSGQRIGYIGKVNSGCCKPMLHFELYSGRLGSRRLRSHSGKFRRFQRRSDLLNPSTFLQKLECRKFGRSFGKRCRR